MSQSSGFELIKPVQVKNMDIDVLEGVGFKDSVQTINQNASITILGSSVSPNVSTPIQKLKYR